MNLEMIKAILFPDEAKQALFIAETIYCHETIPGESFDEKLFYLFHHAKDNSLQIVLAPFLREEVFQYLLAEKTTFAQATKQEHIKCGGESLYDEQITLHFSGEQVTTPIYQDFIKLYDAFILGRGRQIWAENLQSTVPISHEDAQIFSQLKAQFLHDFPQTKTDSASGSSANRLDLWDRIYTAPPEIQEFDAIRQAYIHTWGPVQWAHHFTPNSAFMPVLEFISKEDEQEELGFPSPPTPAQDFNTQKLKYIEKYGATIWETAHSWPIVSEEAQQCAYQLKQTFIAECGQRQWARIYDPAPIIGAFDAVKNGFIKKWSRELWDIYSAEPNSEDLNPEIMADFIERKQQFVDYWNQRDNPDAWEHARAFPEISPASLALINHFKDIFIKKWGKVAWVHYLDTHRNNAEYATDIQLKVLGELFNLRVEVTDITRGEHRTTMPLREHGEQTIHFYCQDNTHYYVHDNGYDDTIGDGNCGYNGFAQWLQLHVLGQMPRRTRVITPSSDVDPETYVLIQNALLQKPGQQQLVTSSPPTIDSSIQPFIFSEEITIRSIRKELELSLTASVSQLAKFIQTKANGLTHIIRAKKLPYNRVAILQKISKLAAQFEEHDQEAALITLKTTLLRIANSVYLPNTQDVSGDWTRESFEANIRELQACVPTTLPSELFQDLGSTIITTDFNNKAQESFLSGLFAPNPYYSTPSKLRTYHPQPIAQEEDCLSAVLCIAGIFILIIGMSCLASLIFLALISGPTPLGILLMQYGFQGIATSLGAILGLSAPSAAILAAGTAATMFAGLGYTLFKDSAPPSMLAALSPGLSSTMGPF